METDYKRVLEAIILASPQPIKERELQKALPEGEAAALLPTLLADLQKIYEDRGIKLMKMGDSWAFRTAPDLAPFLSAFKQKSVKLSNAALETLAIIAYHQPITRAEIEEIRGVAISKGLVDHLIEIGWVKPKGRKKTPGRPLMWATTETFLDHFGLESVSDLPGIDDLKAAGLLDQRAKPTTLRIAGDDSEETPDMFSEDESEMA